MNDKLRRSENDFEIEISSQTYSTCDNSRKRWIRYRVAKVTITQVEGPIEDPYSAPYPTVYVGPYRIIKEYRFKFLEDDLEDVIAYAWNRQDIDSWDFYDRYHWSLNTYNRSSRFLSFEPRYLFDDKSLGANMKVLDERLSQNVMNLSLRLPTFDEAQQYWDTSAHLENFIYPPVESVDFGGKHTCFAYIQTNKGNTRALINLHYFLHWGIHVLTAFQNPLSSLATAWFLAYKVDNTWFRGNGAFAERIDVNVLNRARI